MGWTKYTKGKDAPDSPSVELRRIRVSGTTSHIQGPLRCPVCATSNQVAGRPGQRIAKYKYTCRSCGERIVVNDLTFGCNN